MAKGIFSNRGVNCKCGGKAFSRIGRVGEMYCVKCYRRIKKYGYFKRCIFDKNEIINEINYCRIFIYNKKGEKIKETIIDLDDYDKVKIKKWGMDGKGYVSARDIRLHQFILGKKDGYVVDHINGNKLDNRKHNLRHITFKENIWNTSKHKGYYFEKRRNKFIVRIYANGMVRFSKAVDSKKEADKLYKNLKNKYHKIKWKKSQK